MARRKNVEPTNSKVAGVEQCRACAVVTRGESRQWVPVLL